MADERGGRERKFKSVSKAKSMKGKKRKIKKVKNIEGRR